MRKKYNINQSITHWLYAGPFTKDVSYLYHDNYKISVEPFLPFIYEAKDKVYSHMYNFCEGDTIELFGQKRKWKLLRRNEAEQKVTWAKFGKYARLLVTYAFNEIEVPSTRKYKFKLSSVGSVFVHINGEEVFSYTKFDRKGEDFVFEVELKQGINQCVIILTNVHLHCINSFLISLEDSECTVSVPLISNDLSKRKDIEEDFKKFYLGQSIYKNDETIKIYTDEALISKGKFVFSITRFIDDENEDELIFEKSISFPSKERIEFPLCNANKLGSVGKYYINIDYYDALMIQGIRLSFEKIDFIKDIIKGDYTERKEFILKRYTKLAVEKTDSKSYTGLYVELAKLETGQFDKIDEAVILNAINYINTRYDCSDFAIHGVIRMLYKYQNSVTISKDLKKKLKQCILGFKYSEDEQGHSMMFTRSENHKILFSTAEYLAGLMFPNEIFTNSNQNGLFHSLKGRLATEKWIKEKGSYGFSEWHSNTYYEEDMLALLNIYDFAPEYDTIKIMAKNLIDFIVLLIASNSYKGIMATTHGRCYEAHIMYPETEPMSHINWILFGNPQKLIKKISIGAVALSGSNYEPMQMCEKIANSTDETYTLTRMGLFPHKGLGGVNCATYRTKDYMVSGIVDSKKGELGQQVNAGQVLLDGTVPVFVTCFDNASEITRPSYWGGQYRMPKTITYKNILAYIYNIDDYIGYTHCYFPMEMFDKIIEKDKWIFGCKNNAYIALFSLKPYKKIMHGLYKNKELLCLEKKNIWLIEMGSKDKWSSFDKFVEIISSSCMRIEGEDIIFKSPSNGVIELSWDRVCKVNGVSIHERNFPLINNPYVHGEYGRGIIDINYSGQQYILNFNI